jgi:hypothetical protein
MLSCAFFISSTLHQWFCIRQIKAFLFSEYESSPNTIVLENVYIPNQLHCIFYSEIILVEYEFMRRMNAFEGDSFTF